jgi:hypothetical protein
MTSQLCWSGPGRLTAIQGDAAHAISYWDSGAGGRRDGRNETKDATSTPLSQPGAEAASASKADPGDHDPTSGGASAQSPVGSHWEKVAVVRRSEPQSTGE